MLMKSTQKRNTLESLRKMVAQSPEGPMPKDFIAPAPFWQWHRNKGQVQATFGNMLKSEVLYQRQPFEPIPVPAEQYFINPQETETKLCYGTHYDSVYSEEVLKLASRNHHKMSFIHLSDESYGLQLIVITINTRNFPDRYHESYQIRADTLKILVRITDYGDGPFDTRIKIIDNTFGINLGDANLLGVIIGQKITPTSFASIASKFPDPPKNFFTETFSGEKNDATIKRELDAVHTLCTIDKEAKTLSGKFDRWWPILLNHSTHRPKVKVIPNCDEKQLAKAQAFAKDALTHREQIEVINSVNDVSRSVGVVSGPPGTGKTLLAAHMAVIYRKMSGAVMVTTPTQLSADNFLEYVLKIDPSIKPIRPYRQADEFEKLRRDSPTSENIFDAKLQLMEITVILNLRKEERDKVFGKSKYSVARTMMNRALSEVDPQVFITYQPNPADATSKEEIDL